MDIFSFIITIILITASGALAPGPLFFATITHGAKTGAKSGLIFSFAHTIVEFSLILLLALGLISIASEPIVKIVIGIAGGVTLVVFGLYQIRNSIRHKDNNYEKEKTSFHRLFFIGLVFTGLNPYFILWWLTVGAQLILISLEFASLAGVLFMFICHVWMDYLWLTIIAHFSKKGKNILGLKWYRLLMGIFGGILIYFGFTFLIGAIG